MKIALVSDYYPYLGAQVMRRIIEYAGNPNFEFFVVSSSHDPNGRRLPTGLNIENGVRVYRVQGGHIKLVGTPFPLSYGMLWDLPRILKSEKPDIVHIHFPIFPAAWIGTYITQKHRLPLVTTCHGVPEGYKNPILRVVSKLIVKYPMGYCHRHSDIVTAVSEQTAERIAVVNRIPREKITTIYNGVDLNTFRPSQHRNQLHFEWSHRPGIVIGLVAHMRYVKGIQFFIAASARIIQESSSKAVFVIAGEGPLRDSLVSMVKKNGLEKHFFFPGYIPSDALTDFYNSIDTLVQSSLFEGMSQVVPQQGILEYRQTMELCVRGLT